LDELNQTKLKEMCFRNLLKIVNEKLQSLTKQESGFLLINFPFNVKNQRKRIEIREQPERSENLTLIATLLTIY